MRGGRDGKKLGETFDDAQDDRNQNIVHAWFPAPVGVTAQTSKKAAAKAARAEDLHFIRLKFNSIRAVPFKNAARIVAR
jgi:hypothetical protein